MLKVISKVPKLRYRHPIPNIKAFATQYKITQRYTVYNLCIMSVHTSIEFYLPTCSKAEIWIPHHK